MTICYHKEYFALGMIGALVFFSIVVLFEDAINRWLEEFKKFTGVK